MKTLKQWMHRHPFQVVFFTWLFTITSAIAAIRDDLFYNCLAVFVLGLIVWIFSVHNYYSKITGVILAVFLLGQKPARAEQPQLAAIGVGVVVICVGSYCVYKVVKLCQKKFPPKDTNAPPAELSAYGDEYGGACEYSSVGSCYIPLSANSFPYEDLTQNPTTFTLNVELGQTGVFTSMSANNNEGTTQTWDQFREDMASHGLFLTGHSSPQSQYEMNGIPCDPTMVPLELDPYTGLVINRTGTSLRRVVVERSANLKDWFQLLQTDTGEGSRFRVVDTTREGQMFYRVIIR